MKDKVKYGLLKYSSMNIGDEIQSVAASRFLPRVDRYIHRERTDVVKSKQKVKMIMNAWWLWNSKHFPPAECIDPLLISMYIRKELRHNFLSDKVRSFLIDNGPVGCRDKSTLDFLKENDIPAYFSGCLTLTLQRNPEIKRQDYILVVDMPAKFVKELRKKTTKKVYSISRILSPAFTSKDRIELAKVVLYLYHNAHCVVSPCLHVILPCLAFETPVLRIVEEGDGRMDALGRFDGFNEMSHSITTEDFFNNNYDYDFDNPEKNPEKHINMRNDLIKKCTEFTGYSNDMSLLESDYFPLIDLIKMLKYDRRVIKRTLLWGKNKDLLKTFIKKVVFKKTKHDITY